MANRVGSRGLMFLSAEKHYGERDPFVESEIALWVEAVLEDCIPPKKFDELLRDGVLLCRVMNVLQPGSVGKIQKPFTKDKWTENVNSFLSAAKSYGVPEDKLFKPEELVDGSNIPSVINALLALGKACFDHNWEGPTLGPKPTGQKRNWTEVQLRAGEAIIPLQNGTNKFASQKGYRFGAQRDILPPLKVDLKLPKKEGEAAPVEAAA